LINGSFVIDVSVTEWIVELIIVAAVLCTYHIRNVICMVLYCMQVQSQGSAWCAS